MVERTRRATLPSLAAEATPNSPLQRTRQKRRAAERNVGQTNGACVKNDEVNARPRCRRRAECFLDEG